MKRFLERHHGRISGTLSGFDRVLFRGTLRSIAYVKGLEVSLYSQHVLFKDFGRYAESLSQRIIEQAKLTASKLERPLPIPAVFQGLEGGTGTADHGKGWHQTRTGGCVCLCRTLPVF